MDTKNYYLFKEGKIPCHLGKWVEGYTFLFKGNKGGGVNDLRSWYKMIKSYQEQGYAIGTIDEDEITLKTLLEIILEAGKGKQHAVIYTDAGWKDRVGNCFCGSDFK
jgi:hypothetical protein